MWKIPKQRRTIRLPFGYKKLFVCNLDFLPSVNFHTFSPQIDNFYCYNSISNSNSNVLYFILELTDCAGKAETAVVLLYLQRRTILKLPFQRAMHLMTFFSLFLDIKKTQLY